MNSIFQALAELESKNGVGVLCILVRSKGSTPRHAGSKMLVYSDGSIVGTLGGGDLENRIIAEARQTIQDGRARMLEYSLTDPSHGDPGVCGGQVEVYLEPLMPKPTLVVIGAGHVGKAVAHLAKWLGFYVVVNDDRPELCRPEAVPGADAYLPVPMADLPQHLAITPSTYLVMTTRGVNIDVEGLPVLVDTAAAYIGLIGSQRRWMTAKSMLVERGVPVEKLDRVRSPIGLELHAETPEEIAISILAEIIMLRQGGDGSVMSRKNELPGSDEKSVH